MRKVIGTMCFAATLGVVAMALAQPVGPLPAVCTASDAHQADRAASEATKLLLAGNADAYLGAIQQLEKSLTPACRKSLIERDQPTRLRCSKAERELTVTTWRDILIATQAGNLQQIFVGFFRLEEALSPACWLAVNQPDDPTVRATCSAKERDHMAEHAGPAVRATYRLLAMNDFTTILSVMQSMQAGLSPECGAAVGQASARRKQKDERDVQQGRRVSPVHIPQVYDHGGGTLSAPGIGACMPSGCMAF